MPHSPNRKPGERSSLSRAVDAVIAKNRAVAAATDVAADELGADQRKPANRSGLSRAVDARIKNLRWS